MDEQLITFKNSFTREIVRQIQSFEKELPDDKQVAVIIDGSVIVIDRVTRLIRLGRMILHGQYSIAVLPQLVGERVRVVLEPTLPNLTLTSVQRKDSGSRKPIGFLNQDQEV